MTRYLSGMLLLLLVIVLPASVFAGDAKVLVLGFDGMDPLLLAQYREAGLMPNFDRFIADGAELLPFATAIPPQSPVAWSNFITGRDPGAHGIFDFIHRDPETMLPKSSTSEAKGATRTRQFSGFLRIFRRWSVKAAACRGWELPILQAITASAPSLPMILL